MLDCVGAECRSALFVYWATFSFAYERTWSTYSVTVLAEYLGSKILWTYQGVRDRCCFRRCQPWFVEERDRAYRARLDRDTRRAMVSCMCSRCVLTRLITCS